MTLWPRNITPGSYFDPDEWRYRPCHRNPQGEVVWAAENRTFWTDVAATQYAKRHAHRVWLAENPSFQDIMED